MIFSLFQPHPLCLFVSLFWSLYLYFYLSISSLSQHQRLHLCISIFISVSLSSSLSLFLSFLVSLSLSFLPLSPSILPLSLSFLPLSLSILPLSLYISINIILFGPPLSTLWLGTPQPQGRGSGSRLPGSGSEFLEHYKTESMKNVSIRKKTGSRYDQNTWIRIRLPAQRSRQKLAEI